MEVLNASHPFMITAVETEASKDTLGLQTGLCLGWSESVVEAETNTEDSEVSHGQCVLTELKVQLSHGKPYSTVS